ncbi:MAG: hypothetical protein J1F11_13750, partial [Oscillospiraceae bacterium]|nr:hypothetical protein [Oscillospiraceae bacterium]
NINEIDPVRYMHETDLEFLLRKTGDLNEEAYVGHIFIDIYGEETYIGRIFIDLDGDDFPEIVRISPPKESEWSVRNTLTGTFEKFPDTPSHAYLSRFDLSTGKWKDIFDMPADTDLNLFHDKENDVYFYIYTDEGNSIHKVCITENGFVDRIVGCYTSTGDYQMAINQKYLSDKKIDFGFFYGKFFIEESSPDIDVHKMNESFPQCELISTVNIQDIIDKYSNDSEMYELVMGPFADSPQPSEYKKPEYNDPKPASYSASLESRDITEKNFEELSYKPDLIYLHLRSFFDDDWAEDIGVGYRPSYEDLYEERTINLSGISKLSGLEYLEIETDNIINTSEIGKLKNLRLLKINANVDDLSFLADMDSLEAVRISYYTDKPADFYAPLYSLKNLKYIMSATDEQADHIVEHAPWINIV